jgi:hypothetical protein
MSRRKEEIRRVKAELAARMAELRAAADALAAALDPASGEEEIKGEELTGDDTR